MPLTCHFGLKVEDGVFASLQDVIPLPELSKVLLLEALDVFLTPEDKAEGSSL